MNDAGTETYFTDPKVVGALAYWRGLTTSGASPEGVSAWPTLSPDFLEGNAAIIWHTTGNLTNVRDKARFPFGVAGLPGEQSPHTVVGGGNLYFFNKSTEAERAAALRFARFLTTPERAADWSIRTGYIATSPAAYETKALRDYVARVPAGRDRQILPPGRDRRAIHLREPARLRSPDQQPADGARRIGVPRPGHGHGAGRRRPPAEALSHLALHRPAPWDDVDQGLASPADAALTVT